MLETIKLNKSNFCFARNLRLLLIGPSQSGKTSWIFNFIKYRHQLCVKDYTLICYASPNLANSYLSHEQKFMDKLRDVSSPTEVRFLSEIPDMESIAEYVEDPNSKILMIIDDFHSAIWQSASIAHIMVRLSSHMGIDIMMTSHEGFGKGPYYSTIFKNLNTIVLFQCLSDRTLNTYLGRKLFPSKKNFLNLAFEKAFKICGPFCYLVFSFDNQNIINHLFSIQTRIFPYIDEKGNEKYLPLYFRWKE